MVVARKFLIRDGEIGTYHVISRCVRRSWLCGVDPYSGMDYSHRKEWVRRRLKLLSELLSIEVCGYSIMDSHAHGMLRTRPDLSEKWSSKEVARRWWYLNPKRRDSFGNPLEPSDSDLDQILFDEKTGDSQGRCELLRKRLTSISWFMRYLNENIARRANREDGCTGRFWEGRFKSVALLDQAAVLACLAYIDLNPIHAGIARTPEGSDHTSGQDRYRSQISKEKLHELRAAYAEKMAKKQRAIEIDKVIKKHEFTTENHKWLSPISAWPLDKPRQEVSSFLNLKESDYLELLDWTGRQHRLDKKGNIPSHLKPILKRMEIETEEWLRTVKKFDSWFFRVAGRVEAIIKAAKNAGKKWMAGQSAAKKAFT